MDSQVIELLGKNRLVDQLLRGGLEVALPARDRGIDLIAYADLAPGSTEFMARPIQMKASSGTSFSIDRKYEKFPSLILAFVWNVDASDAELTYGLEYGEALAIASAMGWTSTASWTEKGRYSTQRPTEELRRRLRPYRMTPEAWWARVTGGTGRAGGLVGGAQPDAALTSSPSGSASSDSSEGVSAE